MSLLRKTTTDSETIINLKDLIRSQITNYNTVELVGKLYGQHV